MATRAEERARGYQRPWQRAGYKTEAAYRTRNARTADERRAALGHRSYADAVRAIKKAPAFAPITSVQSQDPKTGRITSVTVYVPDSKGRPVAYRLRPRPGEKASTFDARMRRVGKAIAGSDAPYVYGTPTLLQTIIKEAS